MLLKCIFDNENYQFVEPNKVYEKENNVYTVIVGKNGTGKSRLLSSIVQDCFGLKAKRRYPNQADFNIINPVSSKLHFNKLPTKIITASTSPFDKFPLPRYNHSSSYSYLGLRGLYSMDFGRSYLSKVIVSLVTAVMDDWTQMDEIVKVLNYLGYTDRIKIQFRRMMMTSKLEKIFMRNEEDDNFRLDSSWRHLSPQLRSMMDDNQIDVEKFNEIINRVKFRNLKRNFELEMTQDAIILTETELSDNIKDLLFLVEAGVLVVNDISLEKQVMVKAVNETEFTMHDGTKITKGEIFDLAPDYNDTDTLFRKGEYICN